MNKYAKILVFTAFLALTAMGYIFLVNSDEPEDKALYQWITSETGYTYYKNDSAIIPTSEETERAHDNFMRIRLNKKVLSVLDSNGRLSDGKSFPDSSILIKEIYSDKNNFSPDILAVMVKLKGDKYSGKDWLWAEYTPKGETEYSVTNKGKVCIKCHQSGDDYARIFDILK